MPAGISIVSRNDATVSDASCAQCHASHAERYRYSAHALTSGLPNSVTMKGAVASPQNVMNSQDGAVTITTIRKGERYVQAAAFRTTTQVLQRQEELGLVIGSGRKAQTYLYWDHDALFELPASWWVATGKWMNSPGYKDGTANFERGSSQRCLECHATSFTARGPERNRFDPASVETGISCQKCHGPGERHVLAHERGRALGDTAARMVNPGQLSRERQMDLCRLCHSGVGTPKTPPLSFKAGDILSDHLVFSQIDRGAQLDVHGSQAPALMRSRCYVESGTLTCTTCHDVHGNQRDARAMIHDCRKCHSVQACGLFATRGESIANGCIECHMPMEKTAKIIMRVEGERFQPLVRNHTIGIYPESSQQGR